MSPLPALEGHLLARLSLRGRLPAREAIDLACQALSDLEAADAVGLVLGDVTRDNMSCIGQPKP